MLYSRRSTAAAAGECGQCHVVSVRRKLPNTNLLRLQRTRLLATLRSPDFHHRYSFLYTRTLFECCVNISHCSTVVRCLHCCEGDSRKVSYASRLTYIYNYWLAADATWRPASSLHLLEGEGEPCYVIRRAVPMLVDVCRQHAAAAAASDAQNLTK